MCKDPTLPTREAIDGPCDAQIDVIAAQHLVENRFDTPAFHRKLVRAALDMWGAPQPAAQEALRACRAACDRIIEQYEGWGVQCGVDFHALRQGIATALSAAPQIVERKAQSVSDNGAVVPAWADQLTVEYRYSGGTAWCPLGKAERMRPDFDGVYRLQPGLYPVEANTSQAHGKSEAAAYPELPPTTIFMRVRGSANPEHTGDLVTAPVWTADQLKAYVDADRAQRPAAPASQVSAPVAGDGWKLVPVEPTPEMLKECNNGPGAMVLTNAEIWRAMLRAAPVLQAGVPASQPVPGEKYCLDCKKLGHLTNECWSTHGLNTPEAREVDRLCRAVNAAAPTCAK